MTKKPLDEEDKAYQDYLKTLSRTDRKLLKDWNKQQKEIDKEILKGNEKAAQDLGKGFTALGKATAEGLEEVGYKIEELSGIAKAGIPAMVTLANTFKGKTMQSQIALTQSLLKAAQSDGVQGVMKFLVKLMKDFNGSAVDVVKFATQVSNILGNFVNENLDFTNFKAMFDQIDETSVSILESVSSIIVQLITKIAQYPSVFKLLEDMVGYIIKGLKAVEIEFVKFDAAVSAIDQWTQRIAGKLGIQLNFQEITVTWGPVADYTTPQTSPNLPDPSAPPPPPPKPDWDNTDVGLTEED